MSAFYTRWPEQKHQVYDENTQRLALQRRAPEDDAHVVPHNLLLTMFSPSCVNVLGFDPAPWLFFLTYFGHEIGRGVRGEGVIAPVLGELVPVLTSEQCFSLKKIFSKACIADVSL